MVGTRSTASTNPPPNHSNAQPSNPSNEDILQQLSWLSSQMEAMDAAIKVQSKNKGSLEKESEEANVDADVPSQKINQKTLFKFFFLAKNEA